MRTTSTIPFARKTIPLALAAASALQPFTALHAQTGGGIEEVLVTAQKRQESLGTVPMSISAISSDDLSKQGIASVGDLAKMVPGFHYTQSSYSTPIYSIRGIGFNETSLGAKPNVSVYVDEVPLPFPAVTLGASIDVQRVEVLKGPQGTLFGQNSTGGAINYIANKPTDTLQAGISGDYGRFNAITLDGFVSGPISDTVKARVALKQEQSDDWQQSETTDREHGEKDKLSGRVLLDWMPTDALKTELNLNGYIDRSDEQAAQFRQWRPLTAANSVRVSPGLPTYPVADEDNRAADWGPSDSYARDNKFYQAALRVDYEFASDLTLTSLTAYSTYDQNRFVDSDGTRFENIQYRSNGDIESISQELRLTGNAGDNARWIVGVNYSHDDVHQKDSGSVADNTNAYALGSPPYTTYYNLSDQTFEDKAVFANLDYDLSAELTAHIAARYTDSSIDFGGCTGDSGDGQLAGAWNRVFGTNVPPGQCITLSSTTFQPGLATASLDEDNTSWRAGLDWKPSTDLLLYGNVSRGYKSGSFPNLSGSTSDQYRPVTQESVDAYELGFKYTSPERTLRLDGAVFYYDYKDKQVRGRLVVPVFGPLEGLVNIPKSTIQGAELQVTWIPVDGLTTNLGVSYIDSEIGTFSNYDPYGRLTDFSDESFPLTPEWQGFVDVQYEWSVSASLLAFVGVNVSHQDSTNGALGELDDFKIDAYTLVDLRAGVETEDGKWRVSAYGRNVTDEYYWTLAEHISDTNVRFTGMPVTYGVSVAYRYN